MSHNTVLSFLLHDTTTHFSPPLKKNPSKWGGPRCTGQSWLDRPIGFQTGEGSGQPQKHREKRGEPLTAHCEVEEKDMFLLKINMSDVFQVLYNKRGKKEMSLFSIIIQTCSTKTTNHIHKPLIGTVYLSENIIEPKNKKSCFFKSVS